MQQSINILILTFITLSCDFSSEFRNELNSRIEAADEAKIIYGDLSIPITDLEIFRELVNLSELSSTDLLANQDFPIVVLIYQNARQVARIGVEFGHVRYVYYGLGDSYEYKTMVDENLENYLIEIINNSPKR